MVKNCDLDLENAALGLRPRAVFSRPRSQFFTIRTSQPANNIYVYDAIFAFIRVTILLNVHRKFIRLHLRGETGYFHVNMQKAY